MRGKGEGRKEGGGGRREGEGGGRGGGGERNREGETGRRERGGRERRVRGEGAVGRGGLDAGTGVRGGFREGCVEGDRALRDSSRRETAGEREGGERGASGGEGNITVSTAAQLCGAAGTLPARDAPSAWSRAVPSGSCRNMCPAGGSSDRLCPRAPHTLKRLPPLSPTRRLHAPLTWPRHARWPAPRAALARRGGHRRIFQKIPRPQPCPRRAVTTAGRRSRRPAPIAGLYLDQSQPGSW